MNVGIIGSGGREHAICVSLKKSQKIKKIFCFPGNAGTAEIAENIEIDLSNFNKIKEFSIKNKINLLRLNLKSSILCLFENLIKL